MQLASQEETIYNLRKILIQLSGKLNRTINTSVPSLLHPIEGKSAFKNGNKLELECSSFRISVVSSLDSILISIKIVYIDVFHKLYSSFFFSQLERDTHFLLKPEFSPFKVIFKRAQILF